MPEPTVELDARPRRITWAVCFLAFSAVAAAWAMSVPIFSAPDEHSHVIRAASVGRGELKGDDTVVDFAPYLVTYVDVPAIYDLADQVMLCYLHHPEIPADCATSFVGSHEVEPVATLAGRYPPYFYALVAPASRVSDGPAGVYGARLLGAAASAAFLASAVLSALTFRRRVVLVGLALAVTPTALYLTGTVNPNGLEIAAAGCFWASGVALVHHGRAPGTRRLLVRLAVAGSALAMIRGAGWVWLVCGVAVLALAMGLDEGRELLRRREVRVTLAVLAAATLAALAWSRVAGSYDLLGVPTDDTFTERLARTTGETRASLHEMIANFGFSDAKAPGGTQVVWQVLLLAVVGTGFVAAGRRVMAAMVLLTGGVIGVPIILETLQAAKVGYFWLGRYTLPLAMGLPLLAAAQLAGRGARTDDDRPRAAWRSWRPGGGATAAAIVALAVAHAASWYWVVRRYAVGTDGPIAFVLHDTPWSPPVPVVLAAVGILAGLGVLVAGAIRPDRAEVSEAR